MLSYVLPNNHQLNFETFRVYKKTVVRQVHDKLPFLVHNVSPSLLKLIWLLTNACFIIAENNNCILHLLQTGKTMVALNTRYIILYFGRTCFSLIPLT